MDNIALTKLGLKNTSGRRSILSILQNENSPVDVGHILNHIHQNNTKLNEVTVYRILDAFVKKGLIDRLEFNEGKFRYELAKSEHHHLICENCGRIEDFSDCSLDLLEKEITEKKKFLVKKHVLEFYGLCQKCQQ